MSSRKEYAMLFQLNAQLGGSYSSTFKSAQGSIASMQKEIAALSKTQSDITAYQKQQGAVEATGKKLEVLQQQYANIQKEIEGTGQYSATLENQLLSKQQQIDKTSASLDQQKQKLGQMGAALHEAGVNTGDLTKESAKLGEELTGLKQKQEEAANGANTFAAVGQVLAAAGIAVVLKEIAGWYVECVDASVEFESAMTGVAKTTDLTDAELSVMARELQALSTEIPATASELAAVAEAAGQLGIAKDYILDFTEVMTHLGVATNLTSEEAASQLAKFANITQMAATDYERLGSTIVALGNNTATTEADIVNMGMRLAAAGKQAGMTEAEIMSISAALSSLGLESQAGGSAFSKVIMQMQVAAETGSGALDDFAEVAGMSAEEFARAFGEDAAGALAAFVTGLSDTERLGASATVLLDEMGITELRMSDALKRAAESGDLFNNTMALGNQAWAENTALQNEAAQRYATTESKLAMMQNAYNNLMVAVGDNFTPALQELYGIGTDVLKGITSFVEKHPAAVKAVTAFVAVFGALTVAIAAYTAATKIATAVSAAFAAATGVALGPMMLIIAGVAAAAALFVLLASSMSDADKEYRSLTSSSREQYDQLQELNDEYERAKGQYGETSDEALALRYQVDELTASYEANKQTLAGFIAETDALIESHQQVISSYAEATAAINTEEQGALALALKLQELGKKTSLTTVEQEQMKAVVDALNESVPDLALHYDEAAQSLNLSADAIRDIVQAQAEQERQTENYRTWVELTKEELALSEQLAEAQENLSLRRKELEAEGWDVDAPLNWMVTDFDDYEKEVERLQAAYDENQTVLSRVTAQAEEYAAAQQELVDTSGDLSGAINEITGQMEELAAAYEEAYNAALSSVQGQYELWDEADKVVATSASSINAALESQVGYWQDYNANLASLGERSADIEGLNEMMASFADGSKDSVNAVAGMSTATDEELAAMVASWQTLQEEQKLVADSLAELEEDFAAEMEAMEKKLADTVAGMDLNEAAAESGRNTIQGFIDAAESPEMNERVRAAYASVAQTAMDAIDAKLQINSPSREMEWRAEMTWAGYINQTQAMEPKVAAAMAEAAGAGVESFNAQEAQIIALAPQLLSYLSALAGGYEAVSADAGGLGGSIVLSLAPVFNISGTDSPEEIEEKLRAYTDSLRDLVLEIFEDAGIDAARREYR